MVAKIRPNIKTWNSSYIPTKITQFPNLLVSGCSFTWNGSDNQVVSWPYYLKFLVDFQQVFDCSQSGSGSNHIFNSVVNEIETNSKISSDNTLIIIKWSGLARVDTIAQTSLAAPWHPMSNYKFNENYSTLRIFRNMSGNSWDRMVSLCKQWGLSYKSDSQTKLQFKELTKFCKQHTMLIDFNAQIYESCLKIIALHHYLKSKGFNFIFLSWEKFQNEFIDADPSIKPIADAAAQLIAPILTIGEFADQHNIRIPNDSHPTTNGHLEWTKAHLIPLLESKNLIK
jgi:hypothetical protein